MALKVGKELVQLKQITVPELREKYHAVFDEPTPGGNKNWLFKRIAWRIQALERVDLGGLEITHVNANVRLFVIGHTRRMQASGVNLRFQLKGV